MYHQHRIRPLPNEIHPIPSLVIIFKIPAWYLPGKSIWSSLLSGSLWRDYLINPNRARIHKLWAMWRREWKTGPLLEKRLPFEKKKKKERKKTQWSSAIYPTWEDYQPTNPCCRKPAVSGFAPWKKVPCSLSSVSASEMGKRMSVSF